jgi:hypothetical protein
VYPAFFAMYVSRERRSSVQAMQFSNGLTNPIALWLGHLMFDALIVLAISTVITVIFAASASRQLKGLGFLVRGSTLCLEVTMLRFYVVVHSCAIRDNWRFIRILRITVHLFSFSCFCNCGRISGWGVHCKRPDFSWFLSFS